MCVILEPLRDTNWARKGPLYGYTCVRCWYTKGLHAAIDGLLIYVACCLCCLVVLRWIVRPNVTPVPRECPGDVPDKDPVIFFFIFFHQNKVIANLFQKSQ